MFVKKKDFDELRAESRHRIAVLERQQERYRKIVDGLLSHLELNTYEMPAQPERTKVYKKFGPEPPEV